MAGVAAGSSADGVAGAAGVAAGCAGDVAVWGLVFTAGGGACTPSGWWRRRTYLS